MFWAGIEKKEVKRKARYAAGETAMSFGKVLNWMRCWEGTLIVGGLVRVKGRAGRLARWMVPAERWGRVESPTL